MELPICESSSAKDKNPETENVAEKIPPIIVAANIPQNFTTQSVNQNITVQDSLPTTYVLDSKLCRKYPTYS